MREEIEAELALIRIRRFQARDLLIRCLDEIDTGYARADVLLDRLNGTEACSASSSTTSA